MWLLVAPKVIYNGASIISLVSTDILGKIISLGLDGIQLTFSYITSSNANKSIKKYQEDLEILDIELKLKFVESWLKMVDIDKIKQNNSLELVYSSITDSCHKVANIIEIINEKIKYHHTKWFQSWRSIYLDDEINLLEKNVKILDQRIKLLNLIK